MKIREATVAYGDREIEVSGRIRHAADAAQALREFGISDKCQEHFVVICLDSQHRPTTIQTVAIGTLNSVSVHPRDVFRVAVMTGAAAIILGHNHPSGDSSPSADDHRIHRRLEQGGELLGIPVLDHVIVTPGSDYCSFGEDLF